MNNNEIRPLRLLRIVLDVWLVLALPYCGLALSTSLTGEGGELPISLTASVWLPLIARLIVGFRIDWLRKNA